MMAAVRRFRYDLESLLNVRRHSLDLARNEELNARRVVSEKEDTVGEVRGLVSGLEQQIRESLGEGRSLDLQQQEVLTRYLATIRQRLVDLLKELAQAKSVHDQAMSSLQTQANRVRALERHRQTKENQHSKAMTGLEYKEQDELWLARIGSGNSREVSAIE